MQEIYEGWWETQGGKLDIETRWTQKVVERQGGNLDIETKLKCMLKIVNQPEGKCWDKVKDIETRWMPPNVPFPHRLTPSWAPA